MVQELTIIVASCISLLFGRNCITALLKNVGKLNLPDSFLLQKSDAFLEIPLDDRPQSLDRVKLGRVWWHDPQIYFVFLRSTSHFRGFVTRSPIDNQFYSGIRMIGKFFS